MIPSGLTYTKKDLVDQFFTPLFIDNPEIKELFTVITDVKTEKELLLISPLEKITKGYQRGTSFTSSTGITITAKTLRVARMKAQVEQTTDEFWETVYQILIAKGVDANDLENSPELKSIIMEAFMDALTRDVIRQGFFGDKKKEGMTNTGGVYSPNGTLDVDYKEYDGAWTHIDAAAVAAEIDSTQVVNINSSTYQTVTAVAAVKTATLTGTSGTANVNINGVDYLATFDTDLTTTAANFATAHAPDLLARFGRVVVAPSGVTLVVTAGYPGMNVLVTVTNVSGNLAGSVAPTTAAVKNTSLVAGAAKNILQAVYEARSNELSEFDDTECRFYVTRSVYENYQAYLQSLAGGHEAAYVDLQNGKRTLAFNGIPVLKRADWDKRIRNDFGGVMPHRVLLTTPQALVIGTDAADDMAKVEAWYEMKDQLNYMRTQYCAGMQIVHPLYIAVAR
jgi:hypothetical protein